MGEGTAGKTKQELIGIDECPAKIMRVIKRGATITRCHGRSRRAAKQAAKLCRTARLASGACSMLRMAVSAASCTQRQPK